MLGQRVLPKYEHLQQKEAPAWRCFLSLPVSTLHFSQTLTWPLIPADLLAGQIHISLSHSLQQTQHDHLGLNNGRCKGPYIGHMAVPNNALGLEQEWEDTKGVVHQRITQALYQVYLFCRLGECRHLCSMVGAGICTDLGAPPPCADL